MAGIKNRRRAARWRRFTEWASYNSRTPIHCTLYTHTHFLSFICTCARWEGDSAVKRGTLVSVMLGFSCFFLMDTASHIPDAPSVASSSPHQTADRELKICSFTQQFQTSELTFIGRLWENPLSQSQWCPISRGLIKQWFQHCHIDTDWRNTFLNLLWPIIRQLGLYKCTKVVYHTCGKIWYGYEIFFHLPDR